MRKEQTGVRCSPMCGLASVLLLSLLVFLLLWQGGAIRVRRPGPLAAAGPVSPSNLIFDRNGRLLYEAIDPNGQKVRPVSLRQIPNACRQAAIATEDVHFYHHPGVDLSAVARAAWQYLRAGHPVSGASTITQQTVRLLYMSPKERRERSLRRKVREIWLAFELEREHTKDEILAAYLNNLYYGNFAVGIGAAAHSYFGEDVQDLDLAQCAFLAGLPQNPSRYNPAADLPAAKARQKYVLSRMVIAGFITADDAEKAVKEPLRFAGKRFPIEAPHFVFLVQQILERELGVERVREGGLRVYTTLDLGLQEKAEEVVRRRIREMQRSPTTPLARKVDSAALLALDPRSGDVLAWVGSPDYFDRKHAGAVNAVLSLRQPGSALKPITYAAAFDPANGTPYTPATVLLDLPTTFYDSQGKPYTPVNYDRRWHGPTSLRTALACSYNVLAVKVLEKVGIGNFLRLAEALGLRHLSHTQANLSLTLGGGEETLLDITAAYGAFANGGMYVVPIAIRKVEDLQGNVLLENVPVRADDKGRGRHRVLDPRVTFLITDILSDDLARSPAFGRFSPLYLGRPAAAKTGTTTDWRDNWTIGYTPDLVTGVWVGNADNEPMVGVSGIDGAGPIWHDFMEIATQSLSPRPFPRPDGLVREEICADSGLLPTPLCPHRRMEWFIAGTEPMKRDDQYQKIAIDVRTGHCAASDTPPRFVEWKVFRVLPPEATRWARENGIPQPPPPLLKDKVSALVLGSPEDQSVYLYAPTLSADEQRVRLSAVPSVAMRNVTFYLDGRAVGTVHSSPWEVWWALHPGDHVVLAIGEGEDGSIYRSGERHFTVRLPDAGG